MGRREQNGGQRRKTTRVIRGSSPTPTSKKNKRGIAVKRTGKALVMSIFKTIAVIMLILIIVLCIIGTAVTVMIMNYIKQPSDIDLNDIELYSNTHIYGKNAEGEYQLMQKLSLSGQQEWIDYDEIPSYVVAAFICAEDERFWEHGGVDVKRTMTATLNELLPFPVGSGGGGSTIAQQLIKNLNQDFEDRSKVKKVQEILGALQLERQYPKESVVGAYINYINLGNGMNGIKVAAKYYFNKEVSELTLAEAASLASNTKSPNTLNLEDGPEGNKKRRSWILKRMGKFLTGELESKKLKQQLDGITMDDINAALDEELVAYPRVGEGAEKMEGMNERYSWYVDRTFTQVQEDLEASGKTSDEAKKMLNGGGLRIYTDCNIEMQDWLTQYFLDDSHFDVRKNQKYKPQGAMIIMDYNGNVQATVGSRTEKKVDLGTDRVQDVRSAGSCMKPITTYALAIDSNNYTYSSLINDSPIKLGSKEWPGNYDKKWTRQGMTLQEALMVSKNTVPVQIMKTLGTEKCYNFVNDSLHVSTLGNGNDRGYNLTLGMTEYGVQLDELCAAYIMFGNDGKYNSTKYYTKVTDASGREVILDNAPENEQVIGADSAYVMNRLLKTVVDGGSSATGRQAKTPGWEFAGKTGTSDNNREFSYVGLSPEYIAAIRFGYDQRQVKDEPELPSKNNRAIDNAIVKPQTVWQEVMMHMLEGHTQKTFDHLDSSGVEEISYCTVSGQRANAGCPKAVGYYKKSKIPGACGMH